ARAARARARAPQILNRLDAQHAPSAAELVERAQAGGVLVGCGELDASRARARDLRHIDAEARPRLALDDRLRGLGDAEPREQRVVLLGRARDPYTDPALRRREQRLRHVVRARHLHLELDQRVFVREAEPQTLPPMRLGMGLEEQTALRYVEDHRSALAIADPALAGNPPLLAVGDPAIGTAPEL